MQLFQIPVEPLEDSAEHQRLGRQLVDAWRTDGVFYIAGDGPLLEAMADAFEASEQFMRKPAWYKKAHVSELAYSGYFNGGEEYEVDQLQRKTHETGANDEIETDHQKKPRTPQNWESFAVSKDLPLDDVRVRAEWPCHGPVPWPNQFHREAMLTFMAKLRALGDSLLRLVALGLGLPMDTFVRLCRDGWHRMQALHYPGGAQKETTSLTSHTDETLVAILAQDSTGGLFVRPPIEGEPRPRNWLESESTSGLYQEEAPWHAVVPLPGTLICFPGDMFQLLTNGRILATLHKVLSGHQERYSFAYFHEPNFNTWLAPVPSVGVEMAEEAVDADGDAEDGIFYGEFFTRLLTKIYPNRCTTKRLMADGQRRMRVLNALTEAAKMRNADGNGKKSKMG